MRFDTNPDQDFLRATTARYLDNTAPIEELLGLRDDKAGYDDKYWRGGADLGWVSLLVGEEHGGGTVSGRGLIDLTLIAHEFGRHAAPGPLVPNNIVACALSTEGNSAQQKLLRELIAGTSTAAWCYSEPLANARSELTVVARIDGSNIVLNGVKRPVESASQADYLLVTGATDPGITGSGVTQVLLPRDSVGISIEPMKTMDMTRRFDVVRFDDVRVPLDNVVGEAGGAASQVDRQLQVAMVIMNAESVGAMETAFDMTLSWAFDRYSFGRPLASYQELKHRFADMKSWLEAGHAISDAAAAAVDEQSPDAWEHVRVAKSFIGDFGSELVQDCVQIHGGIGLTFDHSLHLFVRRVGLNRALLGTPADQRQSIADLLEARMARHTGPDHTGPDHTGPDHTGPDHTGAGQ